MSDEEELIKKMNEDAIEARKEFFELPLESRKVISSWVLKWFMKTGFKRLGRIMVSFAKGKSE